MSLKQQNRFSGVVLKKPQKFNAEAQGFLKLKPNFYIKSQNATLFDGYIPNADHFDHDSVSLYEGSWSTCEILANHFMLSRDRVGAKSIYYYDTLDYFGFANDLKGLLDLPGIQFKTSDAGVFNFLFRSKTTNLVEQVSELKPGEVLVYHFGSLTFDQYKYYNYERAENREHEDGVALRIRNIVQEKVAWIAKDCSALGGMLSGGIDSSIIAASFPLPPKIPFITAISNFEEKNETPYAQEVVQHLGISQWHQVIAQNIDKDLESLHLAMELPTTSLGTFLQYEIFRFCKSQGITDILDGTGADAIFGGHNYYNAIYWNELLRKGKWRKFVREGHHSNMDENWIMYYAKNMLKYYYFPRFSVPSQMKVDLRNNPLLSALNEDFIRAHKVLLKEAPPYNLKHLNEKLAFDFFEGGVTELLRFPDRIGRTFGVASHSVFANFTEIFEFGLNLPSALKIRDGYTKFILRKAYVDLLPEKVLARRDKMGLVAPTNAWMRQHKDLFLSYVDDGLSDYYQVDKMRNMLSEAIDHSESVENYKIFKFISFAIWFKVMQKWA